MGRAWERLGERLANLYDFVQLLVAKNKPMLSWTALPEVHWPEHGWECPVLLRTKRELKGNPLYPGAPFWEPHRQGDIQHFRMTVVTSGGERPGAEAARNHAMTFKKDCGTHCYQCHLHPPRVSNKYTHLLCISVTLMIFHAHSLLLSMNIYIS